MRGRAERSLLAVLAAAVVFLAGCAGNTVTIRSHARPDVQLPTKIKRVAVLEFTTLSTGRERGLASGAQLSNALMAQLAQEGYFQVVERAAVDRITEEFARGAGIQYSDETRKTIGNRLQADALIFGSVNASGTENRGKIPRKVQRNTGQYRQVYDPATGQMRTYPVIEEQIIQVDTLSRDVTLNVDFRLVDVETDQILASRSFSETIHEPAPGFFSQGYAEGNAIANVPSLQQMADRLTGQAVTYFVRHISPHILQTERRLMEGESAQCKSGYEMAKAGNWEGAKQSWEQAIRLNSGDLCALNNLGVYSEGAGNNEQAEICYNKALQLAPTSEDILYNVNHFRAEVLKR